MTADAKVGLLLGLVFIVIIAFLVNGLPSFLRSAEPEDVVINTITPPTGPDLVIDPRIPETARQLEPQIALRESQPPQDVISLNPRGGRPVEPVQPVPPVEPVASAQPVSSPMTPDAAAGAPSPAIRPADFGSAAASTVSSAQTPTPKARIHVIQGGETLARIAQKYYGKEEGNRHLVIQKLYQANSKVLTSPDKVQVGDKLTVPSLSELLGTTPVKTPDASQGLLTKFSEVLQRADKNDQKQLSEYIVKKGDSLWGIAEQTLGDGKRHSEILKVNQDQIKSASDLKAGMHLKIPK